MSSTFTYIFLFLMSLLFVFFFFFFSSRRRHTRLVSDWSSDVCSSDLTVFHLTAHASPGGWSPLVEQKLSLAIAVVLFVTYFCVLGFSLRTHKHLFQGAEEHEDKGRQWSRGKAITILLIATAFVAVLSEF